jgi:hypothetical protein
MKAQSSVPPTTNAIINCLSFFAFAASRAAAALASAAFSISIKLLNIQSRRAQLSFIQLCNRKTERLQADPRHGSRHAGLSSCLCQRLASAFPLKRLRKMRLADRFSHIEPNRWSRSNSGLWLKTTLSIGVIG